MQQQLFDAGPVRVYRSGDSRWPIQIKLCRTCGVVMQRPLGARVFHAVRCSDCVVEGNRARYHTKTALRRARTQSDITNPDLVALRAQAIHCSLCEVEMTKKPGQPNTKHVDHIIPLCIGGAHTLINLRVICATCNLARPNDGSDIDESLTFWHLRTEEDEELLQQLHQQAEDRRKRRLLRRMTQLERKLRREQQRIEHARCEPERRASYSRRRLRQASRDQFVLALLRSGYGKRGVAIALGVHVDYARDLIKRVTTQYGRPTQHATQFSPGRGNPLAQTVCSLKDKPHA